jgi:hypothetical protein
MVDYDEQFDRYVLNIFFDKDSILLIYRGEKAKIIREISERFLNWTGLVPFMYTHFDKCS